MELSHDWDAIDSALEEAGSCVKCICDVCARAEALGPDHPLCMAKLLGSVFNVRSYAKEGIQFHCGLFLPDDEEIDRRIVQFSQAYAWTMRGLVALKGAYHKTVSADGFEKGERHD